MIGRFRRSALYVPGDSEKMLQKSASVPSDMILLNLEDGVAMSQKSTARGNVARALKNVDYGDREITVRINPLRGEIGQSDLGEIVSCRPDGICLPKVETAKEVELADRLILELEVSNGLPGGDIRLHAMIESALGLLRSFEIASASPRMASLIFGSADYASDVRCRPGEDRGELLFALQLIATSARAAGIDVIDAPCFDIPNLDLLAKEAAQARSLGFGGKSALHPAQLVIINRAFDVTEEEIEWAGRVLAELDGAEKRGRALTVMEGKLIDNPHRAAAERILSLKEPR